MSDLPIALDAMGGENMPGAAVEGALEAARSGAAVVLVGDEERLRSELSERGGDLPVVHAADVIAMDEHATDVRRRKESSVVVAARLAAAGEASGFVSMGHSGATMAAALLALGRLKGVERPAILANIPNAEGGYTALIDAGANADCRPSFLQQFALMGDAYARATYALDSPSVGLMSIGEEPEKGNELTRQAHALLAATPGIRFHGNVEGRDLLRGTVDVVVTDGFTGNVMLKLAEGEARVIFGMVRDALRSDVRSKLGGLLAKPALKRVAARLDPAEVGAEPLLGVDGYAFIGHGSSDARAVASGIRSAQKLVAARLTHSISEALRGSSGAAA